MSDLVYIYKLLAYHCLLMQRYDIKSNYILFTYVIQHNRVKMYIITYKNISLRLFVGAFCLSLSKT